MTTTLHTIPSMPEILSPDPPYRQVAEHLRQSIRAGERKPGSVMPTTQEIAIDYRIAMSTAARALALLRDEGWIVTRRSKAALVAQDQPE
jgi:DNA-binding transcriptional regulator YhcF (GntR family)